MVDHGSNSYPLVRHAQMQQLQLLGDSGYEQQAVLLGPPNTTLGMPCMLQAVATNTQGIDQVGWH